MLTAKAITMRFLLTSCRIHIFAREHVGLHYWDFITHLPVTAISIQPLLSSQGIQIFSSWPVVLRCLQTSFLVYETNALFKRSYIATKLTTHPNSEYINVMWLMVTCLQKPHRLQVFTKSPVTREKYLFPDWLTGDWWRYKGIAWSSYLSLLLKYLTMHSL